MSAFIAELSAYEWMTLQVVSAIVIAIGIVWIVWMMGATNDQNDV